MEKALLVSVKFRNESHGWRIEDIANELEELTAACGVDALDNLTCLPERPTPNLLIGSGKAEEIAMLCRENDIDTVIFSRDLSGTQQRNLEDLIGKKVIDRTQLILDIFARHAKTLEGKTQVELAQLQYLMPRLVGKGIMLSRLGGGVGTRGPGEQKLEVDRRRIRKRIDHLREELKRLQSHRQTQRKQRKDNAVPAVTLVGYTNAGKSTLLNALTGASQSVARDGLFTTLDPMSRSLKLPNGEKVVVSDTVGFLHELPHHLIEAFKATLEEVMEADLLIHVIDASDPLLGQRAAAVFEVLEQLDAREKPLVTALNKIDLLDSGSRVFPDIELNGPVMISAKENLNLDKLLEKVQEKIAPNVLIRRLLIPHSRMDLVDLVYREGRVLQINYTAKGAEIQVSLSRSLLSKLLSNEGIRDIS